MLVGLIGYTTVQADAQNNNQEVSNAGDFLNVSNLSKISKDKVDNFNKKISLAGNREFIPGIENSEKDYNMQDVTTIQSDKTDQVDAVTLEDQAIEAEQQQAQTNTQAVVQAAQEAPTETTSTSRTVGTFKISFYDPAVLGSDMGYSGVATNLGVIPRGSRLKITTSQGDVWYRTVNDTGTFAYSNPYQIDVAMPNSMIPSYGITSATVEIV
ncbi:hypothetical protein BTM29_12185 [Companilactobacillus allii]|uniref:Hydrolase n=2 Tax=Companilactobacillus allii TaxID=1847728 RepID=A0A1P8Q6F4_9LACO|nr:hypothetical protein BTM29_12185 [Companilactobacillus allii]